MYKYLLQVYYRVVSIHTGLEKYEEETVLKLCRRPLKKEFTCGQKIFVKENGKNCIYFIKLLLSLRKKEEPQTV